MTDDAWSDTGNRPRGQRARVDVGAVLAELRAVTEADQRKPARARPLAELAEMPVPGVSVELLDHLRARGWNVW
jgi:aminoglycoside phosphotransferase (APT) family kinase protein